MHAGHGRCSSETSRLSTGVGRTVGRAAPTKSHLPSCLFRGGLVRVPRADCTGICAHLAVGALCVLAHGRVAFAAQRCPSTKANGRLVFVDAAAASCPSSPLAPALLPPLDPHLLGIVQGCAADDRHAPGHGRRARRRLRTHWQVGVVDKGPSRSAVGRSAVLPPCPGGRGRCPESLAPASRSHGAVLSPIRHETSRQQPNLNQPSARDKPGTQAGGRMGTAMRGTTAARGMGTQGGGKTIGVTVSQRQRGQEAAAVFGQLEQNPLTCRPSPCHRVLHPPPPSPKL